MSTSGVLEDCGSRTCTLSTLGTVQVALAPNLLAQPIELINKAQTPTANFFALISHGLDARRTKRGGIMVSWMDQPARLPDA